VSLQIILPPRERRCDPDAYWKSTLDALVHAKMLINDSSVWVELGSVDFDRTSGNRATRILLEELEN
jgi:Holliday junction resolvase RusA-like endonuclease